MEDVIFFLLMAALMFVAVFGLWAIEKFESKENKLTRLTNLRDTKLKEIAELDDEIEKLYN